MLPNVVRSTVVVDATPAETTALIGLLVLASPAGAASAMSHPTGKHGACLRGGLPTNLFWLRPCFVMLLSGQRVGNIP